MGPLKNITEKVVEDLVFDGKLGAVVAMLKITAAAAAVIWARRRYPPGVMVQYFSGGGKEGLFALFEPAAGDDFARQTTRDENNPPLARAGQAIAAIDHFFNGQGVGFHN